jgi:predicted nucleotidyltransferase
MYVRKRLNRNEFNALRIRMRLPRVMPRGNCSLSQYFVQDDVQVTYLTLGIKMRESSRSYETYAYPGGIGRLLFVK